LAHSDNRIEAIFGSELVHCRGDVNRNRTDRDLELRRDSRVGHTPSDEPNDLALALGQRADADPCFVFVDLVACRTSATFARRSTVHAHFVGAPSQSAIAGSANALATSDLAFLGLSLSARRTNFIGARPRSDRDPIVVTAIARFVIFAWQRLAIRVARPCPVIDRDAWLFHLLKPFGA
jgi:hypothetical protein